MESLTPNDPIWKLLGKSKPVELRPNFVQDVVRAARQTPQEPGWFSQLKAWWQEGTFSHAPLAWAAAALIALVGISFPFGPRSETTVSQSSLSSESMVDEEDFLVPEFEAEWKNLETMGDLLAVQDTSQLTDREIHMLLY